MTRTARALALVLPLLALASPAHAACACACRSYTAVVSRVIDGDTVVADVYLGFGTWMVDQTLRLGGLDAPELDRGGPGEAARRALAAQVMDRPIVLCPVYDDHGRERRGGFGRIIAFLKRPLADGGCRNVNAYLVLSKHAEPSWRPKKLLAQRLSRACPVPLPQGPAAPLLGTHGGVRAPDRD